MTVKILSLVRQADTLARAQFASAWQDWFNEDFLGHPAVREDLVRAVHNIISAHGLEKYAVDGYASDVVDDRAGPMWAGIGAYYFDSVEAAQALIARADFKQLFTRRREIISRASHLLVREVLMYDNSAGGPLPVKTFSFWKRQPQWTRAAAIKYYNTTHAEVAATYNQGRMTRYIQNHAVESYTNPDPQFDYDGAPEVWYSSQDVFRDMFRDSRFLAELSADEGKFVIRDQLAHFLIESEPVVYSRAG